MKPTPKLLHELTAEQWIILRLIFAALKHAPKMSNNSNFVKAMVHMADTVSWVTTESAFALIRAEYEAAEKAQAEREMAELKRKQEQEHQAWVAWATERPTPAWAANLPKDPRTGLPTMPKPKMYAEFNQRRDAYIEAQIKKGNTQ
jgi:hypothetical protein